VFGRPQNICGRSYSIWSSGPYHAARSALTPENRFVAEVPYVPGKAAVQVIKSVLNFSKIFIKRVPEV
jgi:hypothetical protein